MSKLLIGSHVSMASPEFFLGSVKEAIEYNSTTLMFYTGAPQNSYRIPTSKLLIKEGFELISKSKIEKSAIVVHAPYIINIANQLNESLYEISKNNLLTEIKRVNDFDLNILVLHPGAHVKTGIENGLESIINAINDIFSKDSSNVKIALETMAGKGTEIGTDFDQLAYIINHIKNRERIGVCLDTCHISDSGRNLEDFDSILKEFDEKIGLDKLLVVHINDSKNEIGAHKDRHENIGYGKIGFETINKIVHHPLLDKIPKILETPYVDEKPPYKIEIEMLNNSKFIDWKKL